MLGIATGVRGCAPTQRWVSAISRTATAPVAPFSTLDRPSAIIHPIRSRIICRASASSSQEAPGLQDGQLLLLPGKKGQAPAAATQPAKQRGPGPVTDLWTGWGSHVKDIGLQRVEELVARCGAGAADQDVLLVVYAPWCSYCQGIEAEVEHLAASLAHDKKVVVAKLRGDVPGARHFVKQSLQVQMLPTVLLFPRNSRLFFKHRSPQRDANSLLRFMNSLCKTAGAEPWTLGGPGAQRHVSGSSGGGGGGGSSDGVAVQKLLQLAKAGEAPQQQQQQQQVQAQQRRQALQHQVDQLALQQTQQQQQVQQQQVVHAVQQQVQQHAPVLEALALRGQMAGLAAVLGVSLAVGHMWQGVHNSSGTDHSVSSQFAHAGADQGSSRDGSSSGKAADELDSSISNVVGLLANLLRLRAGLIATSMHSMLLSLLPQPAAAAPATPADSTATPPITPAAIVTQSVASTASVRSEVVDGGARAQRMMQAEAGLFAAQAHAAAAAPAAGGKRPMQQQAQPENTQPAAAAPQTTSFAAATAAATAAPAAAAPQVASAAPAVPHAGVPASAWGAQAASASVRVSAPQAASAAAPAQAVAAAAAAAAATAAAAAAEREEAVHLAAVAALDLHAARHAPLPGQSDEALLTQETIQVDAAESAALLDALLERGTAADVDAFLAHLLQQRHQQQQQ